MGQRRFQTYAAARLGPGPKFENRPLGPTSSRFATCQVAPSTLLRISAGGSRRLSAKRAETCGT